jgi:hypothetical protein
MRLLHTFCQNSNMFRSILIILRDLLNIGKAYIKEHSLLNILILDHNISVDIIKFVLAV